MKKHTALLMITVTLLGIFPLSYASQDDNDKTTAKEVRQEMADAAEAIKNYTADKRDEAAVKLRAALVALDARIEAMEARIDKNWDKMDKVAREQARNTLKALRKQRVEVAEKFGSLQNSTASAWEHMKKGFTDAYESLCSAWEKAEREYKEEDKKE